MIEDKNKLIIKILDLGEFGLIEYFIKGFKLNNKFLIFGVGDDVVVIGFELDLKRVVIIDLLVEGVYFDLGYMLLKYLGYKVVIVNFSDVYVMNV